MDKVRSSELPLYHFMSMHHGHTLSSHPFLVGHILSEPSNQPQGKPEANLGACSQLGSRKLMPLMGLRQPRLESASDF